MLLEISGEITSERMKGWSQSKNHAQLWMGLVIEARSDAVKSNIDHTLVIFFAAILRGFVSSDTWAGQGPL